MAKPQVGANGRLPLQEIVFYANEFKASFKIIG